MGEDDRGSTSLFLKNGRLRPTLRVVAFLVILLLLEIFLVILPTGILFGLGLLPDLVAPTASITDPSAVLQQFLTLVAVVAAVFIARRLFDRRSFVSLGFEVYRGWLIDVAFGLVLGVFLLGVVFLFELATGMLVVEAVGLNGGGALLAPLASAFVVFVIVGISEELINRGYILQNFMEGWGIVIAVIASSALFGLLHAGNPNVTAFAVANLFVAGVLFAVGYLVTRSLWLPIALHFAWNFAEGPIFGFRVSGLETESLISTTQVGPEVVTGGAFGPEGGISGLAMALVGIALLLLWGRVRGNLAVENRKKDLT